MHLETMEIYIKNGEYEERIASHMHLEIMENPAKQRKEPCKARCAKMNCLLSWLNRCVLNGTHGGVKGKNFSIKRNFSYSIGGVSYADRIHQVAERKEHLYTDCHSQTETNFYSEQLKIM